MLYNPKQVGIEDETLIVHIPEAFVFIKKWLDLGEEFQGLTIRWAAGRDAQGALLIIGVRQAGRGFDIAFKKNQWDKLEQEAAQLAIRYGTTAADTEPEITIEIPDDSFSDFIDNCQMQAAEDPSKSVMVEIANYFA